MHHKLSADRTAKLYLESIYLDRKLLWQQAAADIVFEGMLLQVLPAVAVSVTAPAKLRPEQVPGFNIKGGQMAYALCERVSCQFMEVSLELYSWCCVVTGSCVH